MTTFTGPKSKTIDRTKTKTETTVDPKTESATVKRYAPTVDNPSKDEDFQLVSTSFVQYDYLGRIKEATPPGRGTVKYEYFPQGTLKSVTDGVGLVTSYTYDAYDRVLTVTDPSGGVTTNTYDLAGNLKTVQDPNLFTTTYNYDSENHLTSVIDAKNKTTVYTYDNFGNRKTLTDPNGNKTTWMYDDYDRMVSEENQLGQKKEFAYDEAGRLFEIKKADTNRIVFGFDGQGRKNKEEWYVGTNVAKTLTYEYDALGTLLFASDESSSVGWLYESGQLRQESVNLPSNLSAQFISRYQGEKLSEVTTKVMGQADSKLSYSWTPDGLLGQIQQTGANVSTKSVKYTYDDAQRRSKVERFSDVANSVPVFQTVTVYATAAGTTAQNKGNKGRIQSITHSRGSTELAKYNNYSWDAAGRLTNVSSATAGYASHDNTSTFTYDSVNQLVGADYTNTNYVDLNFAYDNNGNRNTNGNVPGADNRQASDATWTYSYDANGNLTKKTRKSDNKEINYTYDVRNRLTDINDQTSTPTKKVHYGYDALDRRYLMTLDNNADGSIETTEYYINQGMRSDRGNAGDELALQLDGNGVVQRRILHGALVDEVLAEEVVTSPTVRETLWTLTDEQGSVRDIAKVVSGNATVVDHIMYDAFGNIAAETDAAIKHLYGYTGREFDKGTGLQYNRARYYDPKQGRWISQDPMSFAAGDANLYRYVGNGATNGSDPSGLITEQEWDESELFNSGRNPGSGRLRELRKMYFDAQSRGNTENAESILEQARVHASLNSGGLHSDHDKYLKQDAAVRDMQKGRFGQSVVGVSNGLDYVGKKIDYARSQLHEGFEFAVDVDMILNSDAMVEGNQLIEVAPGIFERNRYLSPRETSFDKRLLASKTLEMD